MGTWRLVLAWLVVADHTTGLRAISTNLEMGKVAVATFFFISGFLMPLTFDTHYRAYGALVGARKFYVNRSSRVDARRRTAVLHSGHTDTVADRLFLPLGRCSAGRTWCNERLFVVPSAGA